MNRVGNFASDTNEHSANSKSVCNNGKSNYRHSMDTVQKRTLKNESFHESMKLVLFVSQLFCVMPVIGIWSDNLNGITFTLRSFRTIASIIINIFELAEITLSFRNAINANFSLSSSGNAIFLLEVVLGHVLLFQLARKWGSFMKFWAAREDCFLNAPYKDNGMRLKFKIKMVATIFFVLAAVEHIMYIVASLDIDYKQYTMCKIKKISYIKFYLYKERAHIFTVVPVNFFSTLGVIVLTVTATFCWNFIDIFIIVISIGLTKRFDQLNDRIVEHCKNPGSEMFWIEIREHYVKLIQIQESIDSELAYIILLSCASNLFSLCLQLFNSFNDVPFLINKIYFGFSLAYLILRTFSVFYSAALIFEASKKPIRMLMRYPAKLWNPYVQRFKEMVKGETVVLSANKFFYLTKSMILGMAGTIITYELVLMQEVKQDPENHSFCNITRFNISLIL